MGIILQKQVEGYFNINFKYKDIRFNIKISSFISMSQSFTNLLNLRGPRKPTARKTSRITNATIVKGIINHSIQNLIYPRILPEPTNTEKSCSNIQVENENAEAKE